MAVRDGEAVLAWLRRLAGVRPRVGQMWARSDQTSILVLGGPVPVEEWRFSLSSFVAAACRNGWCHDVINLDSGKRYLLNETWLSDSENGKGTAYVRIS